MHGADTMTEVSLTEDEVRTILKDMANATERELRFRNAVLGSKEKKQLFRDRYRRRLAIAEKLGYDHSRFTLQAD